MTTLSVNMNFGEHERNRIKRCKTIRERLTAANISFKFEQGYGGYKFIIEGQPPKNIMRLVRVIPQD